MRLRGGLDVVVRARKEMYICIACLLVVYKGGRGVRRVCNCEEVSSLRIRLKSLR
jgi:hypothetical protein